MPADANTAACGDAPELIVLPCEKDDTDTVFAVKEALRRGFADFLLVGVIDSGWIIRSPMCPFSTCWTKQAKRAGFWTITPRCSSYPEALFGIDDTCAYFSLLNLSGQAEGVTIKHAKYPLQDAAIHCDYQYGRQQ